MERPKCVPEELWHNETPRACLQAIEEMARFFWRMGVDPKEEEPRLPEDWRERIGTLMNRS